MDTTAAAQTAGVTAATIRIWCRRNVIAAIKVAGRWVIDTASLAYRLTLKKKAMTQPLQPLSRIGYERALHAIGRRSAAVKDVRCHAEYAQYSKDGTVGWGDAPTQADMLNIRRGAALATEGYTPPPAKRGPGYAPGLPGQTLGGPTADRAGECHYCGQPLAVGRECDECR